MTTTTLRPDHQAALESVDRIAVETGIAVERHSGYQVCVCTDGDHDPLDRIVDVFPTLELARTEHAYTPASHVVTFNRRVLTAPAREVAP